MLTDRGIPTLLGTSQSSSTRAATVREAAGEVDVVSAAAAASKV